MHVCVVGGGGALAQHVIRHYLEDDRVVRVSAICITTKPACTHSKLWVSSPLPSRPAADVLITMQGVGQSTKLKDMDKEEWDGVLRNNLSSVMGALQGGGAVKDGGNVVVVGSIIGSTGGYGCAAYAAAKAGLVGLVRAAANELASRRVCVNLLELGYVDCGMGARLDQKVRDRVMPTIPLGRFAEPGEVVEAIDFLARTRYMTGGILTFAGGLR